MSGKQTYEGRCHCGAVRFCLVCEPLTAAVRCNCSICIRKGATMSERYFAPAEFQRLEGLDALGIYRFGDQAVNHYFCKTCGVSPFHDAVTKPGHLRLNLGCVEGLEVLALPWKLIDGRNF